MTPEDWQTLPARSVCHGLALVAVTLAIAAAALLPALAVTGT